MHDDMTTMISMRTKVMEVMAARGDGDGGDGGTECMVMCISVTHS